MRRREFIAGLGGVAVAWPLATRAQQGERVWRVGVLMAGRADDPESTRRVVEFGQSLQELGWIEGRNLRIDIRWAGGNAELYRKYATELVALAPEVIVANGGSTVAALQQASRSVPIVFVGVTDPVAFGLVASLARPGGTPPDLPLSTTASARNGWSCSRRSLRASRGWPSCAIPPSRPGSASLPRCNLCTPDSSVAHAWRKHRAQRATVE
jgi:ABC transporter substrate binding protein